MQLISDFWWLWGIALVLSAIFPVLRILAVVKNPSSMFEVDIKKIIMMFVPAWVFGALLLLSVVLHVIRFAQSGG